VRTYVCVCIRVCVQIKSLDDQHDEDQVQILSLEEQRNVLIEEMVRGCTHTYTHMYVHARTIYATVLMCCVLC